MAGDVILKTGGVGRGLLLAVLLMAALAGSARAQGVIELRSSAPVSAGSPVTLRDVAQLSGDEAVALAGLVLRERGDAAEEVSIAEVRRAIDSNGRVNWGRLSLRGSACRLLVASATPAAEIRAEQRPEPAPAADARGTVRELVMLRIGAVAQAQPADLRLAFSPDDREILDMASAGRTVEVTPTGLSDRLPLAIRVFEGERIVAQRTIRVGVEVRREVMIAGGSMRRGQTIGEGDVTRAVQWLGLAARPARADQVIGTSPRSRVSAGQVVMTDDVAPLAVVNKGEQVTVHCISGTIVLTMRARAMNSAMDGERVLLEALDSKRTFYARMDGRGRAVVRVGGVSSE